MVVATGHAGVRVLLMVLPLFFAFSCASGGEEIETLSTTTDLALNERVYFESATGPMEFFGGGCMGVSGKGAPAPVDAPGVTAAGPLTGELGTWTVDDGRQGMRVVIESGPAVLAKRSYSVEYLRSGTIDHISGKAHTGRTFHAYFWGGSCSRDLEVPRTGDSIVP
jgi:hypothetical protein